MTHPYASRAYAASLSHIGEPFEVPEWETWVLRRQTPDGGTDWCGCYPLTIFGPDADISGGVSRLKKAGGVSITVVSGPVAALDEVADVSRRFKQHYLQDNRQGSPHYSKHHRYAVRQASQVVETRIIRLGDYVAEWMNLYRTLVERRDVSYGNVFPESTFRAIADLDGLVTFGAFFENELVSCHLWMSDGHTIHSLFAASNAVGYRLQASYAIYDAAIRWFDGADRINFGGAAGLTDDPDSGLARFKRGFSNAETQCYLYGVILDPDRYDAMSANTASEFFPAYRGARPAINRVITP